MTNVAEKIGAVPFVLGDPGCECQISLTESIIRRVDLTSEYRGFEQPPRVRCSLTVQSTGFNERGAFEVSMQVPYDVRTNGLVIEPHNLMMFSEFHQFIQRRHPFGEKWSRVIPPPEKWHIAVAKMIGPPRRFK